MLEPVGARVLIEEAPTQTRASGLIVPDYYDQIRMGIVVKVGDTPPWRDCGGTLPGGPDLLPRGSRDHDQ